MKGLFAKRTTSKFDVLFALCGALAAVWKANDTIKQYKADQAELNQGEDK